MYTTDLDKGITVYCASSTKIDRTYFDAARELGREIAKRNLPVINGGGRMGLMAAVSDGALQAGGRAIGVIPKFMADAGRTHTGLSRTIVTADMHERKRIMASLAIGVIALPGGVGTFEEMTEMMTWRKLGLFAGNVVIYNVNGYYDDMIAQLRRAVAEGFTSKTDAEPRLVATDAETAVNMALGLNI